jgi:hypothetical protein
MGDTLDLAERLASAARDVLRLNSDIVEQQRVSALAQLRGMLASGQVDAGAIDRVISDATTFNTAQFGSFEEMALEQKKTAGVLQSLSELQAAQAAEAQSAEDERAEAARQTALSQLSALEAQIAQGNQQIDALDALANSFGLLEAELSSGELARLAREQKAVFDAAKAADDAAWAAQQEADAERAGQLRGLISTAQAQLDAVKETGAQFERSSADLANLARAQNATLNAAREADRAAWAEQQRADEERARQLNAQIASAQDQLAALDEIEATAGLTATEQTAADLFSEVETLRAASEAAHQAAVTYYTDQMNANAAAATASDAQIAALGTVDNSVKSVEQAISDLADAQNAVARATQSLAAAQSAQAQAQANADAAQAAVAAGSTATGAGGMPAGWERPNGYVAALFGTYGVPWSETAYQTWLANYANRDTLYGGLVPFTDAWKAAFADQIGSVPSYAVGTDYHPGGLARLHQNELVNLPRGTSVSTAGEVRDMVNELRALRQRNEEMAVELRQIRRFAQSRTDIVEDQRAEQLAAEAAA